MKIALMRENEMSAVTTDQQDNRERTEQEGSVSHSDQSNALLCLYRDVCRTHLGIDVLYNKEYRLSNCLCEAALMLYAGLFDSVRALVG